MSRFASFIWFTQMFKLESHLAAKRAEKKKQVKSFCRNRSGSDSRFAFIQYRLPSFRETMIFLLLGGSNTVHLGLFADVTTFSKESNNNSFYIVFYLQTTLVVYSDAAKAMKLHICPLMADVTWIFMPPCNSLASTSSSSLRGNILLAILKPDLSKNSLKMTSLDGRACRSKAFTHPSASMWQLHTHGHWCASIPERQTFQLRTDTKLNGPFL